jgi:SRSO17 transposase
MKTSKKQIQPEGKKRDYTKPEIKKREQIKEITEAPVPVTLAPT